MSIELIYDKEDGSNPIDVIVESLLEAKTYLEAWEELAETEARNELNWVKTNCEDCEDSGIIEDHVQEGGEIVTRSRTCHCQKPKVSVIGTSQDDK